MVLQLWCRTLAEIFACSVCTLKEENNLIRTLKTTVLPLVINPQNQNQVIQFSHLNLKLHLNLSRYPYLKYNYKCDHISECHIYGACIFVMVICRVNL